MRIPVGYIISFLIGIGVLLLINFINSQNESSIKTNSGLYPMVYRAIEDKQFSLNKLVENEKAISDYKKRLQQSQDILNQIRPSSPATTAAHNTQHLLNEARNLREPLQKAYELTRLQYKPDFTEKTGEEAAIYNIAGDVDRNYSYTFDVLWWEEVYADPDSLNNSPRGASFLNRLKNFLLDSGQLKNQKGQMILFLRNKTEQLDQLQANIQTDKQKVEEEIKALHTSLEDIEEASKDRMLMYVVIPLFGLIVVLLMVLPYIYKNNSDILAKLFEQKVILQIFTVFILVMAILLLGIGNKIHAETLGTLLGGISVYVLQKSMDDKGKEKDN